MFRILVYCISMVFQKSFAVRERVVFTFVAIQGMLTFRSPSCSGPVADKAKHLRLP
jgi:hypothetical protein